MTEQEWRDGTDPTAMLALVRDNASKRKLRLFGAACVRRLIAVSGSEESRRAADLSENCADELVSENELMAAAEASRCSYLYPARLAECPKHALTIAYSIACQATGAAPALSDTEMFKHGPTWRAVRQAERAKQAGIIRDIFGNPFRPVTVAPAWLTATVVSLATAIYDERDFDRLPILADALEDAGCTNGEILSHCRQPAEHVRGCWAVDLVLRRK